MIIIILMSNLFVNDFIFLDTQTKLEKIVEFIKTIEERLQTLEEEKEELKEYQICDKKRRTLEFCIHDRELKETKRKLEEVNIHFSFLIKYKYV